MTGEFELNNIFRWKMNIFTKYKKANNDEI